ncbi:MAG: DUF2145 domain-containing protein [Burkholderiales bacterium]
MCAALLAPGPWALAQAAQLRYCDPPAELDAVQQDVLFRFGAVIKATLDASGAALALVARSGLDLERFGMRYSHAGISLRDSANGPWSIRQLYFDCGERRPRLFDEGVAGFLAGNGDPSIGWFSAVLIPGEEAALERAATDNRLALRLVGATYSANAYAWGLRYQNCNQWLAELLGVAWGGLGQGAEQGAAQRDALRIDAQRWLSEQGYQPTRFEVGDPVLMWLGGVLPWLHRDDHPAEDLRQWRFLVSMPASIEAFARSRVPGARRFEFCHAERRIVIREGWEPIAPGCVPGESDRVIRLDP